jgi:hypothetical protein
LEFFWPFFGDFSLSGAANEVVFFVFFEGPQKWVKSPVLSMPAWFFTVDPDLPAGTPCYNFTGLRNPFPIQGLRVVRELPTQMGMRTYFHLQIPNEKADSTSTLVKG